MPQKRLPKQALHAKANGRRPVGRPRTRWTDYIEDLGWNRLGLRPSEMMEVMEDREVWQLNLELLPRNPHGKAGNEERRRRKCSQNQQKWFELCRNLALSDVVLIIDGHCQRGSWPKSIVKEAFPNAEGRVRRVIVKTSSSSLF